MRARTSNPRRRRTKQPTSRTRRAGQRPTARKRAFDIDTVVRRLRIAVADWADAAMFALREAGYGTLFQQLVGCLISIRTRDEVSLHAALRLLECAPTPAAVAALPPSRIDTLIRPATFHEAKAHQIRALAQRAATEFGGELPADGDALLSFRGIGPKCANLALGVSTGEAHISVDVHVHRVTNRWGIVRTRTPEATRLALEGILPRRYWVEINRLLVPFGKHVCTGRLPRCSTCPVLEFCRQVGVEATR